MTNVLNWIDIHEGAINTAYDHIEGLFNDLNMNGREEDIIPKLQNEFANIFDANEPTRSIIRCMFRLAKDEIIANYPNAQVMYMLPYADGYEAKITVDDETLDLARKSCEE